MTVDCVDFSIPNQGPAFSSHKFGKKSGLRYEIAVCIQTGEPVWIHGPFPCGRYNDITIFRLALLHNLEEGERVEADDGYIGEHPAHIKCPRGFANEEITEFMQQRVRNRQETINNVLKFWNILRQMYKSIDHIDRHGDVVRTILITKMEAIKQGETLFQCGYKDPPYYNDDSEDDDSDSEAQTDLGSSEDEVLEIDMDDL